MAELVERRSRVLDNVGSNPTTAGLLLFISWAEFSGWTGLSSGWAGQLSVLPAVLLIYFKAKVPDFRIFLKEGSVSEEVERRAREPDDVGSNPTPPAGLLLFNSGLSSQAGLG